VAIVADAGRMLGDEARVAAEWVDLPLTATPVVLAGGVLSHPSPLLVDRIMERLDGAVAVRPGFPPVVGAVLLAVDRAGGPPGGSDAAARLGDALAALSAEAA
jgi:hypothetical protein